VPLAAPGLLRSAVSLRDRHPARSPSKYFFAPGLECARICRSTGDVSGIMGGGFEIVSFPFRKPLIQKTEEKRGYGPRVRRSLRKIGLDVYLSA